MARGAWARRTLAGVVAGAAATAAVVVVRLSVDDNTQATPTTIAAADATPADLAAFCQQPDPLAQLTATNEHGFACESEDVNGNAVTRRYGREDVATWCDRQLGGRPQPVFLAADNSWRCVEAAPAGPGR